MVHGDDLITAGNVHLLAWFENELQRTYQTKTLKIVPNDTGMADGNVLNRAVGGPNRGGNWMRISDTQNV